MFGGLRSPLGLAAGVALAVGMFGFGDAAHAAYEYKFFGGSVNGYGGPFDADIQANFDLTGAPDLDAGCAVGPDCISADGGSLAFGGVGKPAVTATAFNSPNSPLNAPPFDTANARVYEDVQPNYGGMGVDDPPSDTNDNINVSGGNILKLTFASPHVLTGVATLFTVAHSTGDVSDDPNDPDYAGSFLLSVDNGAFKAVAFADANKALLGEGGSMFAFAQHPDYTMFYVSGILVAPIPGAAWLFGSGLLGFGWLRRRWRSVREAEAVATTT